MFTGVNTTIYYK